MPPAKSKLDNFTPAEVELLKRWIAEGAEYEPHWGFIPIKQVAAVKPGEEPPMDGIVSGALEKRGLKLQPDADRNTRGNPKPARKVRTIHTFHIIHTIHTIHARRPELR